MISYAENSILSLDNAGQTPYNSLFLYVNITIGLSLECI